MNPTLQIIKSRRSIRSFKEGQIKDHELKAVMEAAQYAPNAGSQAWQFIAVQKKDLIDELSAAAKEAAQNNESEFLRDLGGKPGYHAFYNAPTVILVCAAESPWAPYDCSAATENILLAAESLGLAACWIYFGLLAFSGDNTAKYGKLLGIRDGYVPYCSIALGNRSGPVPDPAPRKKDVVSYIK